MRTPDDARFRPVIGDVYVGAGGSRYTVTLVDGDGQVHATDAGMGKHTFSSTNWSKGRGAWIPYCETSVAPVAPAPSAAPPASEAPTAPEPTSNKWRAQWEAMSEVLAGGIPAPSAAPFTPARGWAESDGMLLLPEHVAKHLGGARTRFRFLDSREPGVWWAMTEEAFNKRSASGGGWAKPPSTDRPEAPTKATQYNQDEPFAEASGGVLVRYKGVVCPAYEEVYRKVITSDGHIFVRAGNFEEMFNAPSDIATAFLHFAISCVGNP